MPDYVPRSDAEFNVWQANYVKKLKANAEAWGIPAEDVAKIIAKQLVWEEAYNKASSKQNRTQVDVQNKEDAREDFTEVLRPFTAQWLTYNSKVTDGDRESMGLTIKSKTRTATPVPTTSPAGTIDSSSRLSHTIRFFDETTPQSKAKPDGVHGVEVWYKVGGDPPKAASELTYLTTNTASPYTIGFDGADAGKTVYYWLRWVNTRNERGPWGRMFSATISG